MNCLKIIVFSLVMIVSSSVMAEKITQIKIEGNQRVETSTITNYLKMQVGDQYELNTQSEAVKNLYATSLFESINIAFNSGILKVTVQETPFVSKVVFTGNSKVKTANLTKEILTTPGHSLSKAKLGRDAEMIREMYKRLGRFSVIVKSKIESQENNRAKVIFEITEGPKTGIKAIYFVGNQNYKDSELKTIIMTKESKWFRFLETNDTYDPDRIEYDKHLLSQFYNSVGFADFVTISVTADLLPTKEGFILTYSIDEGKKYQFGKIALNNKLSAIKDSEILPFIENKEGQVFNMNSMKNMSEKIATYLAEKGYPQVDVRPEITPNRESSVVDVAIVVDQADKIFINQINIEGNLKTEDHVIRRQLKIAEGDVYNRGKIERGERNIRNLDYFGDFALTMEPTEKADRYNMDIKVQEKSTSSIGLDLGYNTSGGPFAKLSFLERNLLGTGRYLTSGVQIGKKNIAYNAGVTDPSFLDKDLSLSTNFFRSENGKGSGFEKGSSNYASTNTGVRVGVGYDITNDLSHEIDYSIEFDKLKAPANSGSIFIQEQMGSFTTSSIAHSLTYDKTDSRVLTKNGYLISGTQSFAGLGGNTKYIKHEVDGKYFKSFIENKYTLKLSAAYGHITGVGGKKVRISDRFNLGDYSLRGFANSGVGPRDKVTDEGLGGQKYYTLSSELGFPVGLPEEFNVTGFVFADAGSLWDADSKASTEKGFHNDKSLRASVGFGVLWVTKIAPIRVDWGFPVKKEKYDEKQTFHIKFSTSL